MSERFYFLLPCYNEEENIENVLNKIIIEMSNETIEDLEIKIVVINDGSTDSTAQITKALQNHYKNIVLLEHYKNKGLGEALKTGIKYILENEYALEKLNDVYLCIMDADNSHEPKIALDMLKKMKEGKCGCVIASRYQKGSKVIGVPLYRNLISLFARITYSLFLPIENVKDYTSGFRLYLLKDIKIAYDRFGDNFITESGFSCMVEILYKLYLSGTVFCEYPILLRYDQKEGRSKMKVLKNIMRSLELINKLNMLK